MPVVVALHDILAPVIELSIAQQKAQSTQPQVLLVIALDCVRNKGEPKLVVGTRPRAAGVVSAKFNSLVDLGVSKGFVLAFVSAETSEDAKV